MHDLLSMTARRALDYLDGLDKRGVTPTPEALARLAELDALPTAEHAQVYEDVQGRLHRALADLDGR